MVALAKHFFLRCAMKRIKNAVRMALNKNLGKVLRNESALNMSHDFTPKALTYLYIIPRFLLLRFYRSGVL